MLNLVLWTIDNEIDPSKFERLCTDLMFREGYRNILPLGRTHDGGRDAEICLYKGSNNDKSKIFFQYSLEKEWERKLLRELKKVKEYNHEISAFVFITSQNVTGHKIDKLTCQVKEQYGWDLIIFHREWLRLQLEEANKDLAQRYLGIPDNLINDEFRKEVIPKVPSKQKRQLAWKLFLEAKYEEAIPKLKALLSNRKDEASIYNALSWCYYSLFNYKEALKCIENSLELESGSKDSLTIKACVLAEDGIETNSKVKLVLARDIFKEISQVSTKWIDFYNLANTLKALGDYENAKKQYFSALKFDDTVPEIWMNLGSCCHYLHEHEMEIDCFDKALTLNPDLSQAMVSKGITLGKVFGKYKEALHILNFAIDRDREIAHKFHYIWYWKSIFLIELNQLEEALKEVGNGLQISPDDISLLDLKAKILSKLWRVDKRFLQEAESFLKFKIETDVHDFRSLLELSLIDKAQDNEEDALQKILKIVNKFADEGESKINTDAIRKLGFSFDDIFTLIHNINFYFAYRDSSPVLHCLAYFECPKIMHEVKGLFWLIYGINFTKIVKFITELNQKANTTNRLSPKKIFTISRKTIEESLPLTAKIVASNYCNSSHEVKVDIMSKIRLKLPDVTLAELCREVGYLLGVYNFEQKELDSMNYVDVDLDQWLLSLEITTVKVVSNELKLLEEH